MQAEAQTVSDWKLTTQRTPAAELGTLYVHKTITSFVPVIIFILILFYFFESQKSHKDSSKPSR